MQDSLIISSNANTSKRVLLNLIKNKEWAEAEQVLSWCDQGYQQQNQQQDEECMFTQCDSSGQIPLHIAIWKKAPDSLILQLIHACEKSVMYKTHNKSTPLHFATFYAAPYTIVETLIRKYPLALEQVNDYGVTPRTYDIRKLDKKTQELLSNNGPYTMSYWMELFIKESYEKANSQRCYMKQKEIQLQKLQHSWDEMKLELQNCKASNSLLQSRIRTLEDQQEEREVLQWKLESLSSSLERSLAESVKIGVDDEDDVTLMNHNTKSMHPPNSSEEQDYIDVVLSDGTKKLEKRVAYLEEKLSEALSLLERGILNNNTATKKDTVVENGWVITTNDDMI